MSRLIDVDRLLKRTKFYNLPNGNRAIDEIDILHAPTVNAILIPEGATNGDMIMAMFPNYRVQINHICEEVFVYYDGTEEYTGSWFRFDLNWWNAPYNYNKEVEE